MQYVPCFLRRLSCNCFFFCLLLNGFLRFMTRECVNSIALIIMQFFFVIRTSLGLQPPYFQITHPARLVLSRFVPRLIGLVINLEDRKTHFMRLMLWLLLIILSSSSLLFSAVSAKWPTSHVTWQLEFYLQANTNVETQSFIVAFVWWILVLCRSMSKKLK